MERDQPDGHLSPQLLQWLAMMDKRDPEAALTSLEELRFPDEGLLQEYISVLKGRSESEVLGLLRHFLFPATTFGADNRNLDVQLQVFKSQPEPPYPMEYW